MLNASEEKRVHAGSIVKGIVTSISANEIQVDIGAKQTGCVKRSELTEDSSAKVEDRVKVGDELDLIVEKVMDQDGVIQLSRKKLASRNGMEEIAKAAESGEVVEGDVTEFNKGGVVASPCGPPITNLPVGLMKNFVSSSTISAGRILSNTSRLISS